MGLRGTTTDPSPQAQIRVEITLTIILLGVSLLVLKGSRRFGGPAGVFWIWVP